jgi:hypothetical protein
MYIFYISLLEIYIYMNKTTTVAILGAILTVAALGVATVAIAPIEAHASNNQQNSQYFDNFNNQQYKSNFQCFSGFAACSP